MRVHWWPEIGNGRESAWSQYLIFVPVSYYLSVYWYMLQLLRRIMRYLVCSFDACIPSRTRRVRGARRRPNWQFAKFKWYFCVHLGDFIVLYWTAQLSDVHFRRLLLLLTVYFSISVFLLHSLVKKFFCKYSVYCMAQSPKSKRTRSNILSNGPQERCWHKPY